MTGGGFGGAIVALVDRGVAPTVAARIVRRYRDRTGRTGHALVTAAAAGAREIG
jgi:galactokinase